MSAHYNFFDTDRLESPGVGRSVSYLLVAWPIYD
jgi:hypothetical protein